MSDRLTDGEVTVLLRQVCNGTLEVRAVINAYLEKALREIQERRSAEKRKPPKARAPGQPSVAVANLLRMLRANDVEIGGPDGDWRISREKLPPGWNWELAWAGSVPTPCRYHVGSFHSALSCGISSSTLKIERFHISIIPPKGVL